MEDIPIPNILKEKLKFGNTEQINALKQYSKKIEHDNLPDKKYRIKIRFSGDAYIDVIAKNNDEAENIADRKFNDEMDFNWSNNSDIDRIMVDVDYINILQEKYVK